MVMSGSNAASRTSQPCSCVTLDRQQLGNALEEQIQDSAHLLDTAVWQQGFAGSSMYVPMDEIVRMQQVVSAIETAAELPGYQKAVMRWAPASAAHHPGPAGAFMGYDFHLTDEGPKLIEVNTNAGGAFLNAILARAQQRCCMNSAEAPWLDNFETAVAAMFEDEWRLQHGAGQPQCIAIVDNEPEQQYLYADFRLAQSLLTKHGYKTLILDPSDISHSAGGLHHASQKIDVVYNRLVDFPLDEPRHTHLHQAWQDGSTVITPNPRVHALLADKRNLTVLSNVQQLLSWGLEDDLADVLKAAVPPALFVSPADADALWQTRRELFFKPASGHGSKGVYRGSKVTKSVFARILEDGYIAQSFVAPSERLVVVDGKNHYLKVDVRLYTYNGKTLMVAARLYQGQATNFRTSGGGFSPVFGIGQQQSQCGRGINSSC